MNGDIRVEYNLTQDVLLGYEQQQHRSRIRPFFQVCAAAVGVFFVIGSIVQITMEGLSLQAAGRIVIGILCVLNLWPLTRALAQRRLSRNPIIGRRIQVNLSENRIHHSFEDEDSWIVPWEAVREARIGRDGILLVGCDKGEIWLPYDGLQDGDHEDLLTELVRAKVRRIRKVD